MRESSCTWNNNLSIGPSIKWNTNNGILCNGVVAPDDGEAKRCVTCLIRWCRPISSSWVIDSLWVIRVNETLVSIFVFFYFLFFDAKMGTNDCKDTLHQIDIHSTRWSFDCLFDMTVDFNSIFVLGAKCLINVESRVQKGFRFAENDLVNMTKNSYINIYFSFCQWMKTIRMV